MPRKSKVKIMITSTPETWLIFFDYLDAALRAYVNVNIIFTKMLVSLIILPADINQHYIAPIISNNLTICEKCIAN